MLAEFSRIRKMCDSIAYFANISETLAGRLGIVELDTPFLCGDLEACRKPGWKPLRLAGWPVPRCTSAEYFPHMP